ncbi:MAG: GntR family transcriptional regulator [Anaerolineales bacterium]
MKIQIDLRSDVPVTSQIVTQIQQSLATGALKPGDQMPTVRALATELRVNFNTVARAYRVLDESGIISTQQGRGTFIMEQPPPEASSALRREALSTLARRYLEESQRLGFSPEESLQAVEAEGQRKEDNEMRR